MVYRQTSTGSGQLFALDRFPKLFRFQFAAVAADHPGEARDKVLQPRVFTLTGHARQLALASLIPATFMNVASPYFLDERVMDLAKKWQLNRTKPAGVNRRMHRLLDNLFG